MVYAAQGDHVFITEPRGVIQGVLTMACVLNPCREWIGDLEGGNPKKARLYLLVSLYADYIPPFSWVSPLSPGEGEPSFPKKP